ncbi:MAG: protein YgfX [Candidatus Methylopumilus sp.]|jgi:hypothetical protein
MSGMRLPRLIPLCRSRRLSLFLIALHVLALLSVCVLFSWAWFAGVVAVGVALLSLFYCLRAPSIAALRLGGRGDLFALLIDGGSVPVTVLPNTVVFSHLVVLQLRADRAPIVLSLLPDSFVVSADFRRLKVWLRARATISEKVDDDEG